MSIITFWSDNKKQIGQTLAASAVATYMAMEHNHKVLLIGTDYNDPTLESAFGSPVKNKGILASLGGNVASSELDSGIEGLTKMSYSNRLLPELIPNYTKVVFRNRLEVLYGAKDGKTKDNDTDYNKIISRYKDILSVANRYYDLIFVDLNKGLDLPHIKDILTISDIIIVNVDQRMKSIDNFLETRGKEQFLNQKNVMLLINRYDKFSKYTPKNIMRYIGERREIYTVPYNTLFFEACDAGKIAEFFLKIRKVDEQDRNAIFIYELKRLSEAIIYKLKELQMRV